MGYVLGLLKSTHEGRLRAFWRLLLQFVVYSLLPLPFAILTVIVFARSRGVSLEGTTLLGPGSNVERMMLGSPVLLLVTQVILSLGTVASVWLATRFLDRRPFVSLGLRLNRDWWLDLGFGMVLGALLMVGIFLTEWAAGWVTITGTLQTAKPSQPFGLVILFPILLFVAVGVGEELLSRGYQLKNMAEGLNFSVIGARVSVLLALFLSSSVFGLLHVLNPNTTAISTINIAVAGLLLGAGYVLTGQLAISIGLHITWNFFQGNVFGFPVSGLDLVSTTFIATEQSGPRLWTGGAFGPEGGLLDPVASFVGIVLIVLWVRRRYGKVSLDTSLAMPPAPSLPSEGQQEES
jgi:uncharacterized protein